MSTEDRIFQNAAADFSEKMPAHLWDRLDEKLTIQQQERKIKHYKWWAIAATVCLIATGVVLSLHQCKEWNDELLVFDGNPSMILEDIDDGAASIYNASHIKEIKNVYARISGGNF